MVSVAGSMQAGIHFQLDVEGEVLINRSLSRFAGAVKDMGPFWADMMKMLENVVEEQFESEGASHDKGWEPLNPRYAARKAAQVGSKPILYLHGGFRKSFKVQKSTPDTLEWGSKDPKGKFHQRGTKHMPQRRVIALNQDDRRGAMKALQLFVVRKIREP